MKEIRYVAVDSNGRIVFEEKTFQMIYKVVSSFNRSHNDKKLRIAKKIITIEIQDMSRR